MRTLYIKHGWTEKHAKIPREYEIRAGVIEKTLEPSGSAIA